MARPSQEKPSLVRKSLCRLVANWTVDVIETDMPPPPIIFVVSSNVLIRSESCVDQWTTGSPSHLGRRKSCWQAGQVTSIPAHFASATMDWPHCGQCIFDLGWLG